MSEEELEEALDEIFEEDIEMIRERMKVLMRGYDKALTKLVEKDKVIDLMACELAIPGKSIELINLYNQVHPDKPIDDVIKKYFYKKVEKEND